jgi:hypothetical protein
MPQTQAGVLAPPRGSMDAVRRAGALEQTVLDAGLPSRAAVVVLGNLHPSAGSCHGRDEEPDPEEGAAESHGMFLPGWSGLTRKVFRSFSVQRWQVASQVAASASQMSK